MEESLDSTWHAPTGPAMESPREILTSLKNYHTCLCIKKIEVNDPTWLIFAEDEKGCLVLFKEKRVFGGRVMPEQVYTRLESGSLGPILDRVREIHKDLPVPAEEIDFSCIVDAVTEVFYREGDSEISRFEIPVNGHFDHAAGERMERLMASLQKFAYALFKSNFVSADTYAMALDRPTITVDVFDFSRGVEYDFAVMLMDDGKYVIMTSADRLDFDSWESSRAEFDAVHRRLKDAGLRKIQTYCSDRLTLQGSLIDISYYASKSDFGRLSLLLPELALDESPARSLMEEARKLLRDYGDKYPGPEQPKT